MNARGGNEKGRKHSLKRLGSEVKTVKEMTKKVTIKDKYKTELCKNYEMSGNCHYGSKCKYAHGKKELRKRPLYHHKKYRSKFCENLLKYG